jgi:hypothetical protein
LRQFAAVRLRTLSGLFEKDFLFSLKMGRSVARKKSFPPISRSHTCG